MPGKKNRSLKHPKMYEGIKRKLMREGMSEDKAQESAARISNANKPKRKRKK